MKTMIIMSYLLMISLVVLSGYMMIIRQEGAGWVIALAAIMGMTVSYKETHKKDEK